MAYCEKFPSPRPIESEPILLKKKLEKTRFEKEKQYFNQYFQGLWEPKDHDQFQETLRLKNSFPSK
jgi:hypothetical protein